MSLIVEVHALLEHTDSIRFLHAFMNFFSQLHINVSVFCS